MAWLPVIAFTAVVFAVLAFALRLPRGAWEAIGVALVLGLAGYSLQANIGLAGAPKGSASGNTFDGAALVDARQQFTGESVSKDAAVLTADAFVRRGNFLTAATYLGDYLSENPDNSEGWVALGNAILAQAEGNLTEAAIEAYRRGAQADPDDPAPFFFLGIGWLRAGEYERARDLWREALARTEDDSKARPAMEARLLQIDALIAASAQAPRR